PRLVEALRPLVPRASQIPFYSAALGGLCPGERLDAEYWGHNLRDAFRFAAALEELVRAAGPSLFLEISPHPGMGRAIFETAAQAGAQPQVLGSLTRGRDDREMLLRSLGGLHAAGRTVRWPRVEAVARPVAAASTPSTPADEVRALVAEALCVEAEHLDVRAPLTELGLESVGALSLLAKLNARFGTSLGVSELLRLSNVAGITARMEGGTEGAPAGP